MNQFLVWNNKLIPSEHSEPESDNTPKLTVERWDNHIYFYSDVDTDRVLDLMLKIRDCSEQLEYESRSRWVENTHPIWLHIHSGGGDLFAAFSIADQIKNLTVPIYSIIEGYCASAATIIALACQRRYIQPSALMLIHQLSSVKWGKYEDFKDEMNMLTMTMENLVTFYTERTKLTEAEVRELLKRDSWFNAAQCVEKGLVDSVMTFIERVKVNESR